MIYKFIDWLLFRNMKFGRIDYGFWTPIYKPSPIKYDKHLFAGWILQAQESYKAHKTLAESFQDANEAFGEFVAALREVSKIDRLLMWMSSWFDRDKKKIN